LARIGTRLSKWDVVSGGSQEVAGGLRVRWTGQTAAGWTRQT